MMAMDNVQLIQLAKKIGRQEAINHLLKIHSSKSKSIEELRLFDWLITELTEWSDRQEKLDNRVDDLLTEGKSYGS